MFLFKLSSFSYHDNALGVEGPRWNVWNSISWLRRMQTKHKSSLESWMNRGLEGLLEMGKKRYRYLLHVTKGDALPWIILQLWINQTISLSLFLSSSLLKSFPCQLFQCLLIDYLCIFLGLVFPHKKGKLYFFTIKNIFEKPLFKFIIPQAFIQTNQEITTLVWLMNNFQIYVLWSDLWCSVPRMWQ